MVYVIDTHNKKAPDSSFGRYVCGKHKYRNKIIFENFSYHRHRFNPKKVNIIAKLPIPIKLTNTKLYPPLKGNSIEKRLNFIDIPIKAFYYPDGWIDATLTSVSLCIEKKLTINYNFSSPNLASCCALIQLENGTQLKSDGCITNKKGCI